ncbi:alpha/beta hydrolase [Clostridium sp. CF012]|uniref:alpha/beta hydrolase n=1 Tax=Clostridium sp. CF012 TaxID=2843319 RepID=UPI001C0B8068|nr:alpha/beta hydrolase [Clostridium sp. CF012]MBU3145832.1 alpha/beta hydrolase [Clostridium sp. CF012]
MKRKYHEVLLEAIKQNEKEEVVNGIKVLVKPIPEGGEPGDMDPRLYKSMRKVAMLIKFMPKPKKNQSALKRIKPMRKMFNEYKGIQLVEEGVTTQYFNVSSADGYQVPVRVYKRTNAGTNLPMFVYFHGGGFFGGSADVVEQMCKVLVQNIDCVAFNVDYRLCPENHYPQPFDDCFFATKWAYDNAEKFGADKNKIAVSGDSAGGNLAAAVTLRDREEKTGMVKLQVLIYPAVNISGKKTEFYQGVDLSKYQRNKRHGKVLDATLSMMNSLLEGGGDISMLEEVYLQGNINPEHIYASPLLDDMHNLPPVLLIFGEHDFLVFEDFAYARTFAKAGGKIKTIVYRGLGHGFADQIGVIPQAEDCMKEIASYMKEIL